MFTHGSMSSSHPLCRRSKRLKSNSMVVPFRCADFLGQLVALEE